jgi:hypothetical protein
VHVQRFGDLLVGKVFEIAKTKDLAFSFGKSADRFGEVFGQFGGHGV